MVQANRTKKNQQNLTTKYLFTQTFFHYEHTNMLETGIKAESIEIIEIFHDQLVHFMVFGLRTHFQPIQAPILLSS